MGGYLNLSLPKLSDREGTILKHRVGFEKRLTLAELGLQFGVTRERIRQIEKKTKQRILSKEDIFCRLLNRLEEEIQKFPDHWQFQNDRLLFNKLKKEFRYFSDVNEDEFIKFLTLARGISTVDSNRWPHLSFLVCFINPPILSHPLVRKKIEEQNREEYERTREWSYDELILKVLRDSPKPLHWREIATRAEEIGRKENFIVSAMFNSLLYGSEFVRVSSGTYGLKERGIVKVKEFKKSIVEMLMGEGRPLSLQEVTLRMKKHPNFKLSSLNMSLGMHPDFYQAVTGLFGLRIWLPKLEDQSLRTPGDLVENKKSRRRLDRAIATGYDVNSILKKTLDLEKDLGLDLSTVYGKKQTLPKKQ